MAESRLIQVSQVIVLVFISMQVGMVDRFGAEAKDREVAVTYSGEEAEAGDSRLIIEQDRPRPQVGGWTNSLDLKGKRNIMPLRG